MTFGRTIGTFVLGFVAIAALFFVLDPILSIYARFACDHVFTPLGITKWPKPLLLLAVFAVCGWPMLIPVIFFETWGTSRAAAQLPDRLRQQLADLDRARSSIAASLDALGELKTEISTSLSKHEELRALVDCLQSTATESSDNYAMRR
jgi:hypothetical protein